VTDSSIKKIDELLATKEKDILTVWYQILFSKSFLFHVGA
jgi:hypothetical protein